MSKTIKWDDESNLAQNNFVSWGAPGDFVLGTLIGVRDVKSTLPGKEGQNQKIYDVLVKECKFHKLDEKKRVSDDLTVIDEGEVVSLGGRQSIDSRMRQVKLGQVFGAKFIEEIAAKTKGFNPTKVIKIFVPKNEKGDYEMNNEWLESQKNEVF